MNKGLKSYIATWLIMVYLANFWVMPQASAQPASPLGGEFRLPEPGQMVSLSPAFSPAVLKGIKLDPKNPFRFNFFVDTGDDVSLRTPEGGEAILKRTSGPKKIASPSARNDTRLKEESTKLIKYFLASLTIPEKDLWVNLSPYEKDRIVPSEFGQTEMGRDLLAQDYMLKQITASLIYPEGETGKEFWRKVYAQAQAKYGTTNIPINTFNKVWIVPEKAVVYENKGTAFVLENHLKVMLEEDYVSLMKHDVGAGSKPAQERAPTRGAPTDNHLHSSVSNIIREIVIPALTKEVNEGKNFAQLRQVFYSLILATWYKKKIKDSILAQVYVNRNKVAGVTINDVGAGSKPAQERAPTRGAPTETMDTNAIYQHYLKAFKKGVYNYIKEEPDQITGQTIPKKYFSGGVVAYNFTKAMISVGPKEAMSNPAMKKDLEQEQAISQRLQRLVVTLNFVRVPPALAQGSKNAAMTTKEGGQKMRTLFSKVLKGRKDFNVFLHDHRKKVPAEETTFSHSFLDDFTLINGFLAGLAGDFEPSWSASAEEWQDARGILLNLVDKLKGYDPSSERFQRWRSLMAERTDMTNEKQIDNAWKSAKFLRDLEKESELWNRYFVYIRQTRDALNEVYPQIASIFNSLEKPEGIKPLPLQLPDEKTGEKIRVSTPLPNSTSRAMNGPALGDGKMTAELHEHGFSIEDHQVIWNETENGHGDTWMMLEPRPISREPISELPLIPVDSLIHLKTSTFPVYLGMANINNQRQPVIVKIALPGGRLKGEFNQEMFSAQILDRLGVFPKVYGMFKQNNLNGYVMQYVPGEVIDFTDVDKVNNLPSSITEERQRISLLMLRAGVGGIYEYKITPPPHQRVVVMDAGLLFIIDQLALDQFLSGTGDIAPLTNSTNPAMTAKKPEKAKPKGWSRRKFILGSAGSVLAAALGLDLWQQSNKSLEQITNESAGTPNIHVIKFPQNNSKAVLMGYYHLEPKDVLAIDQINTEILSEKASAGKATKKDVKRFRDFYNQFFDEYEPMYEQYLSQIDTIRRFVKGGKIKYIGCESEEGQVETYPVTAPQMLRNMYGDLLVMGYSPQEASAFIDKYSLYYFGPINYLRLQLDQPLQGVKLIAFDDKTLRKQTGFYLAQADKSFDKLVLTPFQGALMFNLRQKIEKGDVDTMDEEGTVLSQLPVAQQKEASEGIKNLKLYVDYSNKLRDPFMQDKIKGQMRGLPESGIAFLGNIHVLHAVESLTAQGAVETARTTINKNKLKKVGEGQLSKPIQSEKAIKTWSSTPLTNSTNKAMNGKAPASTSQADGKSNAPEISWKRMVQLLEEVKHSYPIYHDPYPKGLAAFYHYSRLGFIKFFGNFDCLSRTGQMSEGVDWNDLRQGLINSRDALDFYTRKENKKEILEWAQKILKQAREPSGDRFDNEQNFAQGIEEGLLTDEFFERESVVRQALESRWPEIVKIFNTLIPPEAKRLDAAMNGQDAYDSTSKADRVMGGLEAPITDPNELFLFLNPHEVMAQPDQFNITGSQSGLLTSDFDKRASAIKKHFNMFTMPGNIIYNQSTEEGILITGATNSERANITSGLIKKGGLSLQAEASVIAYIDSRGVLHASLSPSIRKSQKDPDLLNLPNKLSYLLRDGKVGFMPIGTIINLSIDKNIKHLQIKADEKELIKNSRIFGINVLIPQETNQDYDALSGQIRDVLPRAATIEPIDEASEHSPIGGSTGQFKSVISFIKASGLSKIPSASKYFNHSDKELAELEYLLKEILSNLDHFEDRRHFVAARKFECDNIPGIELMYADHGPGIPFDALDALQRGHKWSSTWEVSRGNALGIIREIAVSGNRGYLDLQTVRNGHKRRLIFFAGHEQGIEATPIINAGTMVRIGRFEAPVRLNLENINNIETENNAPLYNDSVNAHTTIGSAQANAAMKASGAVRRFAVKDSKEGGINLNPAQMSMQVKGQEEDFKFQWNGQTFDSAQITGATFTIRSITPVIDLSLILGLNGEFPKTAFQNSRKTSKNISG